MSRAGAWQPPLRLTSCQAPIAEPFWLAVADWLGRRLGLTVEGVDLEPWELRRAAFDAGEVAVCWLCGPPYVWRADGGEPIELLAAPVMAGARYENRPVYYSDVVVRASEAHRSFADLEGCTWAINERSSHSGYFVTKQHLAGLGRRAGYFGRVIESGSHQRSLDLLRAGDIDATAIDSTVLDLLQHQEPDLEAELRVIACLGPSPMPPWVLRQDLPLALRQDLRQALLAMHLDEEGRSALAAGQVGRFAAVTDADYDPIRRMLRETEGVAL